MRGVLMMLGVAFHAAQVFNPAHSWKIYSPQCTPLAGYLVEIIGVFRMPAFFAISGFFCLYSVRRYSSRILITTRMKRILVPLLATALTLNTVQALLLDSTGWKAFDLGSYIGEGRWVSHLWFLENLLVYFAAVYAILTFAARPVRRIAQTVSRIALRMPMVGLLLLLPLISMLILALPWVGFPLYFTAFGVWDTFSLLIYAQFFAFGGLLFVSRDFMDRFAGVPPWIAGGLIALAVAGSTLPFQMTKVYCASLITWSSISLCFFVFSHLAIRPSIAIFMSEVSFTVYLFHHLMVIVFGLALVRLGVPGVPGLLLLFSLVLAISIAIHHWAIHPSSFLRFAFNGK